MAVLSYNEILPKTIINYNGEPCEVLSSHIFRMQKRKPVNQTRLRNMVSGSVLEISFHSNETVTEAEIDRMQATYLYSNQKESWFAEKNNPKNRFSFPFGTVHDQVQWLTQNSVVEVLTYEEKPMTIKIPVKVELKVEDAPPAVKGNTVSGGTKLAVLSTGAKVNVPLFINTGDIVRVNTDSGEYAERVEKA
ncbi:elongation factor P [Patescibacteria group bacterium]|nr:elongation factor P [Patescibacteria group bacterium]MDE2021658.1 elongation factor P [Patescibacteria group bacterium]MDE2173105.1 elongation factor P [Patescibacteria group bacterium]